MATSSLVGVEKAVDFRLADQWQRDAGHEDNQALEFPSTRQPEDAQLHPVNCENVAGVLTAQVEVFLERFHAPIPKLNFRQRRIV